MPESVRFTDHVYRLIEQEVGGGVRPQASELAATHAHGAPWLARDRRSEAGMVE